MAANAKPALEKIRRIQKTKRALFRAIPQNSTKFFSEQRADWSSAALELSKAPKESGHNPFLFKGIQRSAEIRLVFIVDSRLVQDLDKSFRGKVSVRTLLSGTSGFARLASDFALARAACPKQARLHKTKPIRTNGYEHRSPPLRYRRHKTGRLAARGRYPVHRSTGSAFPKVSAGKR
jgi:hypothetical protein